MAAAVAATAWACTYWWLTWWVSAVPTMSVVGLVFGVSAAFAIVAGVFARILVRGIVSPLNTLTHTLRSLDAAALDSPRSAEGLVIRDDDPLEVAQLKRAFASAIERIRRDRIQRETVLGGLVHDLKTPVVAQRHLLGHLTTSTGALHQEVLATVMENAHDIAERLDRTIDVVRVDVQEDLQRSHADLAVVARDVVRRLAAHTPPDLAVLIAGGGGTGLVHPPSFERALENVVGNAIRFARRRVTITVRVGVVAVSDDGPGFAMPFEDAIDPFRPGPRTHGPTGTAGLGLYVARRSLEAFGGRLVLEKSGAAGTTLLLYVPVAP